MVGVNSGSGIFFWNLTGNAKSWIGLPGGLKHVVVDED